MEFTAYELDGYVELDGKEFIEENRQLLEELGGRTAYIFPTERLADLASTLGLESGEEFMSQDKILDRELLKYVGYTANKRDLVNALREAGIFVRHADYANNVRDTFLQAVSDGTLTKEHLRSFFFEAGGSVRSYKDAIKDMIEKKVEFPITDKKGKFLWASPDGLEPAMMRITDIDDSDWITLITTTPVYSRTGTTLIEENPGIKYSGKILTNRMDRVVDIKVMYRYYNEPSSHVRSVSYHVGGIREAVESHMLGRVVEESSNAPSVLRRLIARYM